MTTNPSDQPRPDDRGGAAPPPPPAPSGYEAQVPPGSAPPPAGHGAPPPAYGQGAPAYGQAPPADGQAGYPGQPPYGGYGGQGGGYGGPPPGYPTGSAAPLSDVDQRMWATLAHVGGIILGFIAPLVVWLVFKERGRFVDEQAKEALNFQITVAIVAIGITVISVLTLGFGSILFLLLVVAVIFMIMAAVAANRGEPYRYPVNIRLIK